MKTNIIIIICSIVIALLGLIYAYKKYKNKQPPKTKFSVDAHVISSNNINNSNNEDYLPQNLYNRGGRRHIKNRKKHKKKYQFA